MDARKSDLNGEPSTIDDPASENNVDAAKPRR
jgi:hypothetical protein